LTRGNEAKLIGHDLILCLDNAATLALMIMISVTMYHLKLTLTFIVKDKQDQAKMSIEDA